MIAEFVPAGKNRISANRKTRLLFGVEAMDCLADLSAPDASPAQNPLWIRSWIEAGAQGTVLVMHYAHDRPVLGLPLEISIRQGVRIARFLSGRHANGNMPLMAEASAEEMLAAARQILAALGGAGIDILHLERQEDDPRNPFLAIDRIVSPDSALALSLEGGFEAVLERHSGKRKRKKHRSQLRKFEIAGGWRVFMPGNEREIRECLDAFFRMKARQFDAMGARNPFADPVVQDHFLRLFSNAARLGDPPFRMLALEVGGRLRAISGFSICQGRMICEFTAHDGDGLAHASPGDFLLFESIRQACERGMRCFDFSVGDLPYKRHWADGARDQFDSIMPLTPKGRVAAHLLSCSVSLRRRLKRNTQAMKLILQLRRLARQPRRASSSSSDT